MTVRLIANHQETWSKSVDKIRHALGAPENPNLFPPHFLKAAFLKIGGLIAEWVQDDQLVGYVFLFPWRFVAGQREYLAQPELVQQVSPNAILAELNALMKPARCVLSPHESIDPEPSDEAFDGWHLGCPSQVETKSMRALQKAIWGGHDDFLYPASMHPCFGGPGLSTVVRADQRPVAMLTAFNRFSESGGPALWHERFAGFHRMESQLLGVSADFRGKGLGFILKKYQARKAAAAGIGIVHWTADPLQWRNAGLNFKRLGAVAFSAHPNLIPFENSLNKIAPSRLALTWLVKSRRVQQRLAQPDSPGARLPDKDSDIVRVNQGPDHADLAIDARRIAFEIPADWTAVQHQEPGLANQWRQLTDEILVHYLGCESGRYMITGIGQDQQKKYLLADRVNENLLQALAE